MLPHLPCSCRLWEKALSLKCFQAVLFKEWQNREEIHTAMERPRAFPKTPNKQAKELQREKFTLWYSSYSTAPEILGHTVSWWWARSWTHKPWLLRKKGHLHHRARSESHACPQTSSARKKIERQGLAGTRFSLEHGNCFHATLRPACFSWARNLKVGGAPTVRHNQAPWTQEYNPTAW